MLWQLAVGLLVGGVTAWLCWRFGLVSLSGAGAVGGTIVLGFVAGGWVWGSLLVTLYLTLSLWERYSGARVRTRPIVFEDIGPQSLLQVLASMAWPIALLLLKRYAGGSTTLLVAFTGSVAALSADAWATRVGRLSAKMPRLITNGKKVMVGTPGGVSVLGIVAAAMGSWLVGFVGLLAAVAVGWFFSKGVWDRALLWLPLAGMGAGVVGSFLDSFLGAAAQAIYYCERCERYCERPVHVCGEEAQQIRGWSWLTNEGVDFVSSVVGAAVSSGIMTWLAQISL